MEFKGTKTEWEVIEHNWCETSICSNGKTICKFELDDIEEEDLTENDLTEEENSYNIQLIKHSKEMLEMLKEDIAYLEELAMIIDSKYWTEEFRDNWNKEMFKKELLIKQATEL